MKVRAYPALWVRIVFDIVCIIIVGLLVSKIEPNYKGNYSKLESRITKWMDKAEFLVSRFIKLLAGDSWKEVEEWKILDC